MVNYLYRCPERHETTVDAPIGQCATSVPCACGLSARRVFTPPMLSTTSPARRRSVEAAEASAESPTISGPPPAERRRPRPPSDPRHANLPRP